MKNERPNVLVIAGYDQSGGAGVLADVKTLEAHGVYAYAVCTGLTFQNERTISRIQWLSREDIFEQIDLCFRSVPFEWVKIGITRSAAMLGAITRHLRQHHAGIKIVLDPVVRASSGATFWEGTDRDAFREMAGEVYLLTPNWEEIGWLYPEEDPMACCERLSADCHIYLKGGHHPVYPGRDWLWSRGRVTELLPAADPATIFPKHGSGCVLASSLAANLALGHELPQAAAHAKRYTEQFLNSNKTLLGWHRSWQAGAPAMPLRKA